MQTMLFPGKTDGYKVNKLMLLRYLLLIFHLKTPRCCNTLCSLVTGFPKNSVFPVWVETADVPEVAPLASTGEHGGTSPSLPHFPWFALQTHLTNGQNLYLTQTTFSQISELEKYYYFQNHTQKNYCSLCWSGRKLLSGYLQLSCSSITIIKKEKLLVKGISFDLLLSLAHIE